MTITTSPKTSGQTFIDLLTRKGPLFANQIATMTLHNHNRVLDICKRLIAAKKISRRKVRIPNELRGNSRKVMQWQFYIPGAESEKPVEVKSAPFPVLRGSGLFGRPIVLRPGSDWALLRETIVTMTGVVTPSTK